MLDIASTLEAVTIYREGALCVRRSRIVSLADSSPTTVRLRGLPLCLIPGSLRARVEGASSEVRVLDVRPDWDVMLADAIDEPAEFTALTAAKNTLSTIETQLACLNAEVDEFNGLRPLFLAPRRGAPPRETPVAAMLSLADFVDGQLSTRLERRRRLNRELADATAEVRLREARLADAGSAKRTERSRLARSAIVALSRGPASNLELSLEYQVPGARWAPSYQLRLEKELSGGTLRMLASVAQDTGEDWVGVKLALSTASLQRRTDAPELRALKIGRTQPEPPSAGWREPPPGLEELFSDYDDMARRSAALEHTRLEEPRGAAAPEHPGPLEKPRAFVPCEAPALYGESVTRGKPAPLAGSRLQPPQQLPTASAPARTQWASAAPQRRVAAGNDEGPSRPSKSSVRSSSGPAQEQEYPAEAADLSIAIADFEPPSMGDELTVDFGRYEGQAPLARRAQSLEAQLLDYAQLVLSAPVERNTRGRLHPAQPTIASLHGMSVEIHVALALMELAQGKATHVAALALPPLHHAVQPVDSFDYRYACDRPVDLASTGSWTTLQVMTCQVGLSSEFLCVPSVDPAVFRTIQLDNRSPHALLPGPVDVSTGETFIVTTSLPAIAPGAADLRLGLGVEESIKVARRTHFSEVSGGFLGGSSVLQHALEIEINNRLPMLARVEVRERVPVPDGPERDVKVEETAVEPPWERVETPVDGEVVAGLRRWKLSIPPGERSMVRAQFAVRIPADRMLVGGNRRT